MTNSNTKAGQLGDLMKRFMALRLVDMPRLDTDLTLPQMEILRFVAKAPECHLQDIADGLELTAPTVSVGVRRLEETGWLERHTDPNDKRATCISLTKMSSETISILHDRQKIAIQQFLDGLNETEQAQFIDLFGRAVSAAEKRRAC